MPDANEPQNPPVGGSQTFTQEQVNSMMAEQKRKMREQYSDFEKYKADSKRLAEIEEANKSELQKANEARAAAEKELASLQAKAEIEQIKKEVAKEKGVPVDVLRGETREDLEEHADLLKENFKTSSAPIVKSDGKHPKNQSGTDPKGDFAALFN